MITLTIVGGFVLWGFGYHMGHKAGLKQDPNKVYLTPSQARRTDIWN